VNPVNEPVCGALHRQIALIATQIKGSSCRAVRSFHFNQALATTMIEGEDVIACSVSIFCSNPSHLPGQVSTIRLSESLPLNIQDESLTCLAQTAITTVSLYRIEFLYEPS
jgi:hypothetical protein